MNYDDLIFEHRMNGCAYYFLVNRPTVRSSPYSKCNNKYNNIINGQ